METREQFEKWAKNIFPGASLETAPLGIYINTFVQTAWVGWAAGVSSCTPEETAIHCFCPTHQFKTADLYAFWDHLKTHNFESAPPATQGQPFELANLKCYGCGRTPTRVHKSLVVPVCDEYPRCESAAPSLPTSDLEEKK